MKATFLFDGLMVLQGKRNGMVRALRRRNYTRALHSRKFLKLPLVSQHGELLMFVLIRQRFALFARLNLMAAHGLALSTERACRFLAALLYRSHALRLDFI
jgi:hypothetical protein